MTFVLLIHKQVNPDVDKSLSELSMKSRPAGSISLFYGLWLPGFLLSTGFVCPQLFCQVLGRACLVDCLRGGNSCRSGLKQPGRCHPRSILRLFILPSAPFRTDFMPSPLFSPKTPCIKIFVKHVLSGLCISAHC